MKILELPAYFLPNKGGIEYCVYYLGKEFAKDKNQVTIVSSDINSIAKEEFIDGIKVKRIKSFSFLRVPVSFNLKKALMKEEFDIIHLHYPHPFFLDIGAKVALKKKKPYMVHCHGKEIEIKGFLGLLGRIYNRLYFDKVLKNASKIITNTSKVIPQSKYLSKYKSEIKVIPHGVDVSKFKKVKTNLRDQLGLKESKVILYAGALRWYKGLDYLIKAFAHVLKDVTDARLIIIGKGEEEKRIKKLARNLGLSDKVIFLRFVNASKLIEYYSIADLFILPSPNIEESFGLVAFEALSMNIPTIVTSGAGVSEVFEKEKIGVIVKPNNAEDIALKAVDLLKNPKKRKKIAEKGRKIIAKKYSWREISKAYLNIFKEAK